MLGSLRCKNLIKDSIKKTSFADIGGDWYATVFTLRVGISSSRYTSKFVIASISSSILNHSQMVPLRSRSRLWSLPHRPRRRFHPSKQLHVLRVCRRIFVGMWVHLEGTRGATVGCGPSYPNVWVYCDGRPGGEVFRLVLVLFWIRLLCRCGCDGSTIVQTIGQSMGSC